jgi:NADH:ubiquinone oxidoreductase subunit C
MRNLNSTHINTPMLLLPFFTTKAFFFFDRSVSNNQCFIEVLTVNLYRVIFLFMFFTNDIRLYLIDLFLTKPVENKTDIFYIFSSFNLNFITIIKNNEHGRNCINSCSSINPGVCWPERELSEFSGVLVDQLGDSRRLLSDYTCNKQFTATHLNFYNLYDSYYNDILL